MHGSSLWTSSEWWHRITSVLVDSQDKPLSVSQDQLESAEESLASIDDLKLQTTQNFRHVLRLSRRPSGRRCTNGRNLNSRLWATASPT